MKCPDHPRELISGGDACVAKCPFCRGQLMTSDELSALVPNASSVLEPEAAQVVKRDCPQCKKPMAALRIGVAAAWVERCADCELLWVEPGDVRTLSTMLKSAARKAAYASMSAEERASMAGGLAEAVAEASAPAMAVEDVALAALGVPAMSGARGTVTPVLTWVYSAALVLVQFAGESDALVYTAGSAELVALFTAQLAHFGWLHLIGNVVFMLVFGANAERGVPRWLFAAALLVLGPITIGTQALFGPADTVIGGASGVVAACLGICLFVQRRARVTVWLLKFVNVPLWVYGVFWALLQLVFFAIGLDGTAWLAHLSGFAAGLLIGAASSYLSMQPHPHEFEKVV